MVAETVIVKVVNIIYNYNNYLFYLLQTNVKLIHWVGTLCLIDYTIRELTNHAVELFALKALQGEIITDEDPYTIPQAG